MSALVVALFVVVASHVGAPAASAQYQGHHFKGDFGVNSGTQPGPGLDEGLPSGRDLPARPEED